MFNKIILDNGMRVVTYKMPGMKSVSVGIWTETGSRCETLENNGVSHFIEHMLFKGTKKRSAKKIAEIFDSIGGQINAFTGKECTCYYTKTLAAHLDISLDVLSDVFFNSSFAKDEMELEREVILEEINMYEDSPEEMVHDLITETVWTDSLGYPILGSKKNVKGFTRENLMEYMEKNYTANRVVISVAGDFDDKNLYRLVKKHFGDKQRTYSESRYIENAFHSGDKKKSKKTEQINMCIAYPEFKSKSELIYPGLALNNILGDGMSSRLFQEIREKRGMAYSVYSYTTSYMEEGVFVIYAGCNPTNADKVEKLIYKEVNKILDKKVTKKEIDNAKQQLRGNFLLGLENTAALMSYAGKSELLWNEIEEIDEVLKKIDNVNAESVAMAIDKIFDSAKPAVVKVGDVE